MKKNYIKPETEYLVINACGALCTSIDNTTNTSGGSDNGSGGFAPKRRTPAF